MTDVLEDLRSICGEENAVPAADGDRVAGVPARFVARPASTGDVSRILTLAGERDLHVVVRGAGTKLDWGGVPSAAELMLDLSRLAGVVEHAAGDRVVVVRAGTTMADLRRALAPHRQRLALDEMMPGATVGGVVSTGSAGPLRLTHGAPRDQLIGVTAVRADGVVTHSGGKVVKNVAGYDLSRLMAGSYGTLAVLTQAAFKLVPTPEARAFVTRPVTTPRQVSELCKRLRESNLGPAAIEVECPIVPRSDEDSQRLDLMAVLLEGPADGVASRAERAATVLGGDAAVGDTAPEWWGRYPFRADDVAIQVVTPVGQLFAPVYSLRDVAKGIPVRTFCSPAAGVLHTRVPAETPVDRVVGIVNAVRTVATLHGGHCVVLSAPPEHRAALDMWGPVDGLDIMRSVKHRLDPESRLAPGRFVEGM